MFKDRKEAGKKLADKLREALSSQKLKEAIVLAIPRGGVVIGGEINRSLNVPLDCLVTKKIPAPGNEELAIGAVAEGGIVIWEEELCQRLKVSLEYKREIVKKKVDELEKKKLDFKCGTPALLMKDKTVIIADDGVATGATMKAAIAVARSFDPKEVIVAVPVIAQDSLNEVKVKADKVVYLEAPEIFFSVGQFYTSFEQISDEEVVKILNGK